MTNIDDIRIGDRVVVNATCEPSYAVDEDGTSRRIVVRDEEGCPREAYVTGSREFREGRIVILYDDDILSGHYRIPDGRSFSCTRRMRLIELRESMVSKPLYARIEDVRQA